MSKIFISIPMNGKSDNEIKEAMKKIMDDNFPNDELIDSFIDTGSTLQCLGKSIQLLDEADIVVFAPGWEDARGCLIEKRICDVYNKNTIFIDNHCITPLYIKTPKGNSVSDIIDTLYQFPHQYDFLVCGQSGNYSFGIDNDSSMVSIDDSTYLESTKEEFEEK